MGMGIDVVLSGDATRVLDASPTHFHCVESMKRCCMSRGLPVS
jgi:hypothetical protein